MFDADNWIDIFQNAELYSTEVIKLLQDKCLRVEDILDDVPVLESSNLCT